MGQGFQNSFPLALGFHNPHTKLSNDHSVVFIREPIGHSIVKILHKVGDLEGVPKGLRPLPRRKIENNTELKLTEELKDAS
jgi:hypothetical protein